MLETTAQLKSLARQVVTRARNDAPALGLREVEALLAGVPETGEGLLLAAG
jgi:hypothetical protein